MSVVVGFVGGAERMNSVYGVVGMMPVEERIIKTDLEAFRPESLHKFFQEVAAEGGVGHLVIGVFRVPEAEALVMFGSDDRIFHAGCFRHPSPLAGIEEVGVEVVKIFLVLLVGQTLVIFYPFVAGGKSVKAKVDEQAEAGVGPPFEACGFLGVRFTRKNRLGG